MGLSGIDKEAGVTFKVRKKSTRVKAKDIDEDKSGLVIEKPTTKPVSKKSIVDDLKAMSANDNITYKALIDGNLLDYDYATDSELNDGLHKAKCLGRGIIVDSRFDPDIGSGTMIDSNIKLLYFWKKVLEVSDGVTVDSESDEVNTCLSGMLLDRNPELNMNDVEDVNIVDQDDLTNEVKQEEKDLTMNTNTEYTKANELLKVLKDSGDTGVDILIDYCKVSFAEVFTKTKTGGTDIDTTNDLQNQMVYIISEINKNDLLTPESKAKLVKAIEDESVEYQKLLESLTDVTSETKVLLEKKENEDMNWGTIALYTIGAVLAVGAAYSAYRYFEPGDVVLDMSTMSIMDR